MNADIRKAVDLAIGEVVRNASNFPEAVQARLLGQDMAPLRKRLTDAVLAALSAPPADDVREALDLDALEAGANAQIAAIDQMDEVGRGVGGMTRPNLAAYMAWQDASDGYGHADTVLALIKRLRAAEVRPRGTVTNAEGEWEYRADFNDGMIRYTRDEEQARQWLARAVRIKRHRPMVPAGEWETYTGEDRS